jgi:GTP-binding protein HflX
MKRHWRNEIKKVTDQLAKITKSREQQLSRRKKAGFHIISIVGYTNAGKSSLFNLLTKKNILVEDALFATLDSSIGKIYIPQIQKEVLITDTIGFIRNLPPRLINAFKSTLMESMHADVLLHVIDASDHEMDLKIQVVDEILQDLGRQMEDVIFVFNKIDKALTIDKEELLNKYYQYSPIFISVKEEKGIEGIFEVVSERLLKHSKNVDI